MRFLVDEQLPPALADWLSSVGHEADHVRDLGLSSEPDEAVRKQALLLGAVVVTKDQDFVIAHPGSSGPPVVWLRIGNARTSALLARCAAVWPDVVAFLEQGQSVVEVR